MGKFIIEPLTLVILRQMSGWSWSKTLFRLARNPPIKVFRKIKTTRYCLKVYQKLRKYQAESYKVQSNLIITEDKLVYLILWGDSLIFQPQGQKT